MRSDGTSSLMVLVSFVVYIRCVVKGLTPTIATLSIAFLKLTDWFSAYLDMMIEQRV
jgi:hypothetical protein